MSKIDKLSILGVRSFDNIRSETIQFNTPLTLIVGYNGSGKTTIIECLKYATTGELPPNSKTGGAFIHDPKLCGEKEVLAQVKLSFKSTSGARMVATRNLQLTVKKTTRSQKTLEGNLLMIKDGERTAISSRVAELDQILPQYLGVSKAILESVIFCHQDDSLWPMSEPSVLKKKFDEIFEALKYTKAIENIKILRKKQNEELGKYKIIEQHAKEDKDKGDRAEKRSTELYDEIEVLRTQVEDVEAKVAEAKQKSTEAFDHAARFEQIVAQLNGKRITLQHNKENVTNLEINLKDMAESDEELQSMLDQYEERVALYAEQRESFRQQYADLKHELEDNRHSLGVKQGEVGKYEAQKEQHERNLQQRENLIKESAKRHGIRGFDFEVTDKQVAEFLEIIGRMSRDQKRTLDRTRQETEDELRRAQNALDQLKERRSALIQSKDSAKSQISKNDQKIAGLQKDMTMIDVDEGGEANLQRKKDETEQKLKKATFDADSTKLDDRIRVVDAESRSLDEKKGRLETELFDATKLARDSAQIEYAQDQLKGTRHSLETMKGAHGPRISELVEPDWEPASLDAAFQRVVSQKAAKVKEAESHRDVSQSKLDKINYKLTSLESEQKEKLAESHKHEKAVQDAIGQVDISDFEEILREREQSYEMETTEQAKFRAQLDWFQNCLKTAKEDNRCRLCKRSLKEDKAEQFTKAGFLSSIENIIKRAMGQAQEVNVEELSAELEEVRNAKPSYDLWMHLRNTEIPRLESDIAKLASEREAVNQELEEQDVAIHDLQTSKHDIDSLQKNVQSIVQSYNQTRELEVKIKDLSEKQKAAGLSRGIDAIQDELKQIIEEGRRIKDTLDRLSADREKSRAHINSLQLEIRDVNADLSNAQSQLKEKRRLASQIEEFKSYNTEHRDAIRAFDKDIQNLVPQIEQAELKYDDINRRGKERIDRFQEDASKLSHSVTQLSHSEQDINAYIDRGGPQQLARTHREIENLHGELSRIDGEMTQVTRHIKKIDDTMHDTESTKRSINDNIRYRQEKRSLQTVQREIQELEAHNAEKDKDRYEREGKKWHNEWMRLSTESASLYATLKTKDDQLKELIEEWETEYKDAAYKYREAHIKVETTKAAVEDLGRYGGALDKAIMKYHTLKMEEINAIIAELWQKAYQGTDVDRILIRSDNETAKGNRSYNYRVVMVKQDAEMDMRGRCSAGQKVLASIVIRLALAECFGVNCGLIALDEPTTNLDQENIVGLAEALSEIIKIRRKQTNFQLIVITHDEQFLQAMSCADYCDTYYRVSRNDRQKSIIERQSIHEVAK